MKTSHSLSLVLLASTLQLACTGGGDGNTPSSSTSGGTSSGSVSSSQQVSHSSSNVHVSSMAPASSATPASSAPAASSAAPASSASPASSAAPASSASPASSAAPTAVIWEGTVTQSVPEGSRVTFISATIPAGTTVTVGAGVTFEGGPGTGVGTIAVLGTLNVTGTSARLVQLGGAGVSVRSGGSANITYATTSNAPEALSVEPGAGMVTYDHVTVDHAGTDLYIHGGTVLVDHCNFSLGGGADISGAGVRPEIRNSVLSTGSAGTSDFLVINNGGEVYAHHNEFVGEHCAIHINSGAGPTTFSYNVFHNTSYTIMKFNTAATVLTHNNIGTVGQPGMDAFDVASGTTDATGNYILTRTMVDCPASSAVTTYGCVNSPVVGAGVQP